ncbi:hypothetical protein MD484_g8289, partial [Candolleomyces efflorescens]
MLFTGPHWQALLGNDAPTFRGNKAQWPRNLYKLELAAPGDAVPDASGGPEHFALANDQREFVFCCAFFARQAKDHDREGEFLGLLYGRFFARWPTVVTKHFAWNTAKRKERIRLDLQWAYLACRHIQVPMTWEVFLSLPDQVMGIAQAALIAHEKAVCRARPRRAPRLKPQTIVISDSEPEEDDGQAHIDHAAGAPEPRRGFYDPSPEPEAGPSRRRGPYNMERLVRGMEEAKRQEALEERALRRARYMLDEAENDPYGPIF